MRFKVLFHEGADVSLATRGRTGWLVLTPDAVGIDCDPPVVITNEALRSVELFRMHNTGQMLKVTHSGGTLFITVVRFSLFGLFALVNFFATRELAEVWKRRIPASHDN